MQIKDFETEELDVIRQTLKERYNRDLEIKLADTELRLSPPSPELTMCPAVYWEADNCHFLISKTGRQQYHCQFFYGPEEQFSTGNYFYDDIVDCTVSLLRAQADHQLQKKGL